MSIKIKKLFYTWRYFFYNNIKYFQYFMLGYKFSQRLVLKDKNLYNKNKIDLVNWLTTLQKPINLTQITNIKSSNTGSVNFELYFGKADIDTTKILGYIDTRLLDELQLQSFIYNKERDLLLRHLIFNFYLNQKNTPLIVKDKKFLNSVITFPDSTQRIASNKILFTLNTEHLSNLNFVERLVIKNEVYNNYNFFLKKQNKTLNQKLSEYITLFDLNEKETQLSLSGAVDRVLQESIWDSRYRVLPTIVKNLDNPREFITRLNWANYKADISKSDFILSQLQHKLSKEFLDFSFTTKNTNIIQPFILNAYLIKQESSKQCLFNSLTYFEHNLGLKNNTIDYLVINSLNQSNQVMNKINNNKWSLFVSYFTLYNFFFKNLDLPFLQNKSKTDLLIKFSLLRSKTHKIMSSYFSLYILPEYSMLLNISSKLNNLFFLRASVGANWGFLDESLLNEEQEKQDKESFYKKSDDLKQFYYYLHPKDLRFYDDTTYTMEIKDKRFLDDAYKPTLTKPHVRPYSWLQIPEMSFSPFFLFLKNIKFVWYKIFNFKSSTQPSAYKLLLQYMYLTRFLLMNDWQYNILLKSFFSNFFLEKFFNKYKVNKFVYFYNMDVLLKTNKKINMYLPTDVFKDINTLFLNILVSNQMPNYFTENYLISNISDIFKYQKYYLSNNILDTTIKIEQREANQMRFNFMFKLGLSREHSWFFLYNSPVLFKQTIGYQAWLKERIPNTYVWEHDNPFLIQQIFRPYTLDLTKDITLYKYKADLLQLLFLGFKEVVFAETFLLKNYYTKIHKNRSIFEMPKYTVPFFLFDSDLYMTSQIPETILYEHISAFGIPALERQWKFDEIRVDLTERKYTSVWPNYLFNSEAYAMLLWTPLTTKNIFSSQEFDIMTNYKNKKAIDVYKQKEFINTKLQYISDLTNQDLLKIYSYFFNILLTSLSFTNNEYFFTNINNYNKKINPIMYYNLLGYSKHLLLLKQMKRQHNFLKNKNYFYLQNIINFNFYLFSVSFEQDFVVQNLENRFFEDLVLRNSFFYVVKLMIIYYYIFFF